MHHEHHYEVAKNNEKKTFFVIIFTLITMLAEIFYGYVTNSMALLADGYHMFTHVIALSLTFAAYILIRKFQNSNLFPNGTDKIGILSAYTSAIFLGLTGAWIIYEALERFVNPVSIHFNDAILVAFIGLFVNLICIFIMEAGNKKHHEHEEHIDEHQEDYNFKAAYYHILADILTSILAIIALIIGKMFCLTFFDSIVGVLGGILILRWSVQLLKKTVKILIDMKN